MKLREKIKNHYELSKKLSIEYETAYGDIVLYLRCSKLSDVDAEDAIGDILDMLLEAQDIDASIEETLGSDLKQFCDNIILSYGDGNRKTKLRENLQLLLILIVVGTFWNYINIELPKVIKGTQSWITFNFSLAMLLNLVIMSISAAMILKIIIKPSFAKNSRTKQKNQRINFILAFILSVITIAALVVIGLFFRNIILFKTKLYWVVLLLIVSYFVQKFMEPKSE